MDRKTTVFLAASFAFLSPALASPGEGATVSGTLRYQDRGGVVAIRRATVNIQYHAGGFFDVWNTVATVTTNEFGSFSFTDSRSTGWYTARVFASNDAAVVFPVDWHFAAFNVGVGFPGVLELPAASQVDLSWTFSDPNAANFFSVAETLRIALDYANARRAPGETETIPKIDVKPISWNPVTYYNSVFSAMIIEAGRLPNDWLLLHEYGHHLQQHIGRMSAAVSGEEYDWREGFANYFADAVGRMRTPDAAIPDGAQFGQLQETPSNAVPSWETVGATLWDLLDPVGHPSQGVEAHDAVAAEDMTIFHIFDRELDTGAATITAFRTAWRDRGKDLAGLDCILGTHGFLPATPGCRPSTAVKLAGDFDGDGKTDIALTGAVGWGSIPVAFSNGNGSFRVTNEPVTDFASWAADPRASKLTGDFDGDGRTDIALAGGSGWTSVPVALSTGAGGFTIVNDFLGDFGRLADDTEAQKLTGDFNNDGKTDIALVGVHGSTGIPVAFSNGQGGFLVTNLPMPSSFMSRASHLLAIRMAGQFSIDRRTDILLAGIPGISTLPLALSNGNGTFTGSNLVSADFALWSSDPRSVKLAGDFNNDGKTDIALTGAPGWSSVPMLLSNGSGGFAISNVVIGDFAPWSTTPGVAALVGDFDGGGTSDIALTGPSVWGSIPVATSNGLEFTVSNPAVGDFAAWSARPGAVRLVGDFNDDGRSDIALVGPQGWGSVPVAFSNGYSTYTIDCGCHPVNSPWRRAITGDLTFTVTNLSIVDFAAWASMP